MRVVIDTNCLLSCVGKKSPYRNVFDAFLAEKFILCVSNDIILEYEEKFNQFWGEEVSNNLLALFASSSNIEEIVVHYNWNLVTRDNDDNKFTDTYIASASDFLVTNDSDIRAIGNSAFPPLNIVSLEDFSILLKARLSL